MIYYVIIALAILPFLSYVLFSIKLEKDLDVSLFFIVEIIIVFIVSTIAHMYYYISYDFSFFPSRQSTKVIIGIAIFAIGAYFLYDLIFNRKNESKRSLLKWSGATLACVIIILIWLMPLEQKFLYGRMLENIEETFERNVPGKVVHKGNVSIGLISSDKHVAIRGRYQSSKTSYRSYFYIKNNDEKDIKVDVSITLYNEDKETVGSESITDYSVEKGSTEQLFFEENGLAENGWESFSTSTKKHVDSFEAEIVIQ